MAGTLFFELALIIKKNLNRKRIALVAHEQQRVGKIVQWAIYNKTGFIKAQVICYRTTGSLYLKCFCCSIDKIFKSEQLGGTAVKGEMSKVIDVPIILDNNGSAATTILMKGVAAGGCNL